MYLFPRLRRRQERLDARVAEARKHAEQARAEATRSRERAEAMREDIVRPLRKAAAHNQFSDLIRRTLREGTP